jgi:hypothetical protein
MRNDGRKAPSAKKRKKKSAKPHRPSEIDERKQLLDMEAPILSPPEDLVVAYDPSTDRTRVLVELRIPKKMSDYMDILRHVVLDVVREETDFLPFLRRTGTMVSSRNGIINCLHSWSRARQMLESGH